MNDRLKLSLAFIAGVTAGALVAWKALENKYKQIADEEIESVKETFNRKMQKHEEETKQCTEKEKYNAVVESLNYKQESSNKEGEKDMAEDAKVYVIPPESFGEYEFKGESLTYYADKVLVFDSTDEVVENVDEIVGRNSLETFGQYEDDSVFVRNENLKRDFEILLDLRKYSDVVSKKPHQVTDDDDE